MNFTQADYNAFLARRLSTPDRVPNITVEKCTGLFAVAVGVEDEIRDLHKPTAKGSVRLVLDFWAIEGVPRPRVEHRFCERRWKMDFAWPECRGGFFVGGVYLESQGGIFIQGRHTRGAALLKEWEKLNEATILGWRPLFCQPSELMTVKTAEMIKRALTVTETGTKL